MLNVDIGGNDIGRCWCGDDETTGGHVHQETVKPAKQGWECPKCHAVYAPWVMQCKSCKPNRPDRWVGGS